MKLRVKLLQTLIVPTMCYMVVTVSCCVRQAECVSVSIPSNDSGSQVAGSCVMKQCTHNVLFPRYWLNSSGCIDSAGPAISYAILSLSYEVLFSRVLSKRRGRHRTQVADFADDVSHICSFASWDPSLVDNKKEFNHAFLLIIRRTS